MRINNIKNTPSFQMKMNIRNEAKPVLDKELKDFYINCTPMEKMRFFLGKAYNFDEHFDDYKKAYEELTQELDGTAEIIVDKNSKLDLAFTDSEGKFLHYPRDNFSKYNVLADIYEDKGKLFSNATRLTLSNLSFVNICSRGYGGENPIQDTLMKLITKIRNREW